jgi:putative ABC transport system permease protein
MREQCWQDFRTAWRGLCRAPAFSMVAILTLAIGIAGTTAMFALVHGVLLRPLPVRDQDRVVVAWRAAPTSPGTRWPFHTDDLRFIVGESRVFEAVAGVGYQAPSRVVAVERGVAGYVQLAPVTGDFFTVLGVRPQLGRVWRSPMMSPARRRWR